MAGVLTFTGVASAAPGLLLGFSDQESFVNSSAADDAANLDRARAAGASIIRAELTWRDVAPTKPPTNATAADPSWAGYDWAAADRMVRALAAAGATPFLLVNNAPAWAEGSGRPRGGAAPLGTWRPSASAYGAFATALARRYSGTFSDPLEPGRTLPAVRKWQAWNEPNLTNFLTPQWRTTAGGYVAESPGRYRALLNAFYKGVKKVSPRNYVVTAGTAPFGDLHPGERRIAPALFWRDVLCVSRAMRSTGCHKTVWFDAIAHHPYPIGPPLRHAINADDVSPPDLGRITRPLGVALRAGTVRPAKPKQLWITEISWDSRPDPDGLTLDRQAQYLEGSLYVLWKQGADVVSWFLMRDQAPVPSYASTLQSGIFMRGATVANDVAKPSRTAFRFPFTAYRSGGVARLWGIAPSAGPVTIEARQGNRWVTAVRLAAARNRVFTGTLRVGPGTALRARTSADTSLAWRTS